MSAPSRRRLFAAGAAVLGSGSAAACALGGASGASQSAAKSLPTPRTVELWSQWGGPPTLDAQTKLVARYQELNPRVTVTTAVAPMVSGAPEKTITATAAGSPPDVGIFDRFVIASFVAKDTFTPLTDLAKRDGVSERDYYPFAWNEASYKGQLYALPFQTGIRGLYVNVGHLRDAGSRPDQLPRTLT